MPFSPTLLARICRRFPSSSWLQRTMAPPSPARALPCRPVFSATAAIPVALLADRYPVALLADWSPVALLADRYPVALLADWSPVVLLADWFPVALLADRFPVALLADRFPVASLADRSDFVWFDFFGSHRAVIHSIACVTNCGIVNSTSIVMRPLAIFVSPSLSRSIWPLALTMAKRLSAGA